MIMISAILKEFGISWLICRIMYSAKLKMLRVFPAMERFFEHSVEIKRIDLLPENTDKIEHFIHGLEEKEKKMLIQTANLACEGTIQGFSSVEMKYGTPINWQLNPLTGKLCNKDQKWYRIPDFDAERGDIKAVWEVSRFSHFITFARAYLVSGDKKYYRAFREQLANWIIENPYSYGANYKCGQECAFRMMNTLLAYNVFDSKGLTDIEDKKNLIILIDRCYRKILSNFFYAYRCIKNNHTVSELVGMIIGAWCSCDTKRLKKAYKILDRVILKQFSEDGGYSQLSFNYQRLVLQDLEYLLYVSNKTGFSLSEASIERIKNSVLLLFQCQDETGDVPNYGFNDGAWIFPVSSSGYRDFRPVLGSLYEMLFGKRLYDCGNYDEEAIWFGGELDSLIKANEPKLSSVFPDAGLFTLCGNGFWLMTVLNNYKTRPAHMDQLHIDLWVNGVNVFCDSGTYSYANPKGEALALTGAHNTIQFDKRQQMDKKGAFLVYNRTERCKCEISKDKFIGKVKSHNGYTHERYIEQYPNGYCIYDTVTSRSDSEIEIMLHTPCRVEGEGKKIKLYNGCQHIVTIEGTLDYELKDGMRSLYYLSEEPIKIICFKGVLKGGTVSSKIKINVESI